MNLIDSIEEFKKLYDGKWDWFRYNKCTTEVLEYYIDNYDGIIWYIISEYQPLSEAFIDKYKDELDWNCLLSNPKVNFTYEFIEKHVYSFNLYCLGYDEKYKDGIAKLRDKYSDKYEIDKLEFQLNIIYIPN